MELFSKFTFDLNGIINTAIVFFVFWLLKKVAVIGTGIAGKYSTKIGEWSKKRDDKLNARADILANSNQLLMLAIFEARAKQVSGLIFLVFSILILMAAADETGLAMWVHLAGAGMNLIIAIVDLMISAYIKKPIHKLARRTEINPL